MDDRKDDACKKQQEDEEQNIDLMEYARKLWAARKPLLKAFVIGAVVGLVIAFSIPKRYTVEVTLSPELGKNNNSRRLSNLTSLLGINNLNTGDDIDALNVTLFPEIVASVPFLLELFDTQVTTSDGKIDTTFVAYLDKQRHPWWNVILGLPGMAIDGIKSLFTDKEETNGNEVNPFQLTKKQANKVKFLREAITTDVDSKTGVTTVAVTLQDPLVTASITDTVIRKLQEYITAYRVSKAQENYEYWKQLHKERQQEYNIAQENYARYIDANKQVILQTALTERERLANEMNLAYQVYSQTTLQLQEAQAKVQEAKPVFAVVEPATVPLLPSGPSKKIILIGYVFLAVAGTAAWILFGREYFQKIKKELKTPEDNSEKSNDHER